MLQDRDNFAILIYDKDSNENLIHIIQKMSIKRHIGFNRCKLNGDTEYSYVLYDIDKTSLFAMARNKKLKLIWRNDTDFYIIDFRYNTKGDIICYLSNEDTGAGILEGDVVVPNLKTQFQNMKKVQLVSSNQLNEESPLNYEHFVFYIKDYKKEMEEPKIISHTVISCKDKEYLEFVLDKLKDYIALNPTYNIKNFIVYDVIKLGCKTILHELNQNEILDIGCFTNKNTYYNNNIQKYLNEHFYQKEGVVFIEKYY